MNLRKVYVIVFMWLTISHIYGQRIIEAGLGYSGTSVNNCIFRNNAVVSHCDKQYIAYYDPEGYIVLGRRHIDESRWVLHRTQYRGNIYDAHNVISIMVDGAGYLHMAFDHHGNRLNYCRSIAPDTLILGDKEHMIGRDESDVTYPEFYRLPDGDLLFAYRSGASGRGNLILNRYITSSHKWERVQDILIDGESCRNAYWQLCVDTQGTIHISWVWRESWLVESNHDMCYARSTDGGKSWQQSDGTPYTLPINKENAEIACRIPQDSELINQTGMCTDNTGRPYIATYWRDSNSHVPQYRIVCHNGKRWKNRQVSHRKTSFTLKGGGTKMIPIARPRIITDGKRAYYLFRDEERGSRVSMYYTHNIQRGKWHVCDLTRFSVGAWEPNYDSELWKRDKRLHIFVQECHQGDEERAVDSSPTPIYILETEK